MDSCSIPVKVCPISVKNSPHKSKDTVSSIETFSESLALHKGCQGMMDKSYLAPMLEFDELVIASEKYETSHGVSHNVFKLSLAPVSSPGVAEDDCSQNGKTWIKYKNHFAVKANGRSGLVKKAYFAQHKG